MSALSVITALAGSTPKMIRMSSSLFWVYLTLGRRVKKARRAFERQLILQGVSKDDARRLSVCYEDLKNSILTTMTQGLNSGLWRGTDR